MFSARQIAKALAINTAFAFIPPILLLVMSPNRVPLSRLWLTFIFSLVYSHSIGTVCFATIPWIWCAADHMKPWLRWTVRFGAMLGDTVLGSLIACLVLLAIGWITRESYWPQFWGSLKVAMFVSILAGLTIGIYETFQGRLEDTTLQLRTKELERER